MLTIRASQMEALARASFEAKAIDHLWRCLPERCAMMGREAVRLSVRAALERSRNYGLTEEIQVFGFLNLMYTFDFNFDTHPDFAWAAAILTNQAYGAGVKLELLRTRARQELEFR